MTDYARAIAPDMRCSEVLYVPDPDKTCVRLVRRDDVKGRVYMHTEWAQGQVFSHFGVRPRWFEFVVTEVQAEELNRRLNATPNHRFRPLLLDDATGMARGFVSPQYAEIADTDVMAAIEKAFPPDADVRILPEAGKTDQCLYAHVVRGDNCSIGCASGTVYFGLSILNSEVGYTALRVLPVMYLGWAQVPVPIPTGKLFRRIHRGTIDLNKDLGAVLSGTDAYLGDLQKMVDALHAATCPSADAAKELLETLVLASRGSKSFVLACRRTYDEGGYQAHTGMTIVEAIAKAASAETDEDSRFLLASVAGTVAARLIAA